jgi:hypothetical protein
MTDFDWVTARSKCSLGVLFEVLKAELQEDVDKRMALFGGAPSNFGFRIASSNNSVSVLLEGIGVRDSVVFQLTATAIEVKDRSGALKLSATPTLNDNGECRLKINGEEKELWHLRKIALEELFFRAYS